MHVSVFLDLTRINLLPNILVVLFFTLISSLCLLQALSLGLDEGNSSGCKLHRARIKILCSEARACHCFLPGNLCFIPSWNYAVI